MLRVPLQFLWRFYKGLGFRIYVIFSRLSLCRKSDVELSPYTPPQAAISIITRILIEDFKSDSVVVVVVVVVVAVAVVAVGVVVVVVVFVVLVVSVLCTVLIGSTRNLSPACCFAPSLDAWAGEVKSTPETENPTTLNPKPEIRSPKS